MPAQFATLINLLKAHDLQHLFSTLHAKSTIEELQSLNASNRPMLLAHLQKLGVEKLSDRQALANAVARSEKTGELPAPRPIPHLQPPVFDEDDDTITVKLKVPPNTTSNQLKVKIDVNSLRVDLHGEPTAAVGKLHALVKPHDCLWELVRAPALALSCAPPALPLTGAHLLCPCRSARRGPSTTRCSTRAPSRRYWTTRL